MLILNQVAPYHWAVAGAGIGFLTLLLLAFAKKRLGVSTGFENVCSLVISAPYFERDALRGTGSWRIPILIGLLAGGALSAVVGGGTWTPTWDLGVCDVFIGWGPVGKVFWMFGGGLLIGVGTRMAGGCTSGHGIFGVSNLEKSGIVTAACFMGAGVVTSNIIYRVILGV